MLLKELLPYHTPNIPEAGCDEAGRGCLAGPVFAAAVILPHNYSNPMLQDSKKLSEQKRLALRSDIERDAIAWALGIVDNSTIDSINILKASFLAMHHALDALQSTPLHILVDGNRFTPYKSIPHTCVVKGDDTYTSIAAASILAKTYRDEYMQTIHAEFPHYDWCSNKGYPTQKHRDAVIAHGRSPYHRLSFHVSKQLQFDF